MTFGSGIKNLTSIHRASSFTSAQTQMSPYFGTRAATASSASFQFLTTVISGCSFLSWHKEKLSEGLKRDEMRVVKVAHPDETLLQGYP